MLNLHMMAESAPHPNLFGGGCHTTRASRRNFHRFFFQPLCHGFSGQQMLHHRPSERVSFLLKSWRRNLPATTSV